MNDTRADYDRLTTLSGNFVVFITGVPWKMTEYILDHMDIDLIVYIVVIVGSLVGVMVVVVIGCLFADIFKVKK